MDKGIYEGEQVNIVHRRKSDYSVDSFAANKDEKIMKKDECVVCEGIFAYNEKVIEVKGKRYCEACYEELEENSN
jgi:hypothetical protein